MGIEGKVDEKSKAIVAIELVGRHAFGFYFRRELCVIQSNEGILAEYYVKDGEFVKGIPGIRPTISKDTLALGVVSADVHFRDLHHFLSTIFVFSN